MKKIQLTITSLMVLLACVACDDYLDQKPDQSLVVPTTLEDVRLLLDNSTVFNKQPVLTLHSADEFFVTDTGLPTLGIPEQGAYQWLDDPYQGELAYDWSTPYQQVFYANVALDALDKIAVKEGATYRMLLGEALFHRAHAYFHLLQEFAPPYQLAGGNDQLLGIVLKQSPDINEKAVRANLEESYRQVVSDLTEAIDLLPDLQLPKTRPNKASALGMLARVSLVMFDYQTAAEAAEAALMLYPDRLDFNKINVNAPRPFIRFGEETIFYSEQITVTFVFSPEVFVDTVLIESYKNGDLRLPAFFDLVRPNRYLNRGRLTGNNISFGGLSTGELELIASESLARTGNEVGARAYLNSLLKRRMTPKDYVVVEESGGLLIQKILEERKKELVGRGLRWSDLRRLNQYPESAITLEKMVQGQLIKLEPNSNKYVLPIPNEEILLTGIEQNER